MNKSQIISKIAELWFQRKCSFDEIIEAVMKDDIGALHSIREALMSIVRIIDTHCIGERITRRRIDALAKCNPQLYREFLQKLSDAGIYKTSFYNLTPIKQQDIIGIELYRRIMNETSKNIKMQDEKTTGKDIHMSEDESNMSV